MHVPVMIIVPIVLRILHRYWISKFQYIYTFLKHNSCTGVYHFHSMLQVSIILEDGEPGTPLAFSLENEKSPFGLPPSSSMSLSPASSFHSWNTLNVTIHVVNCLISSYNPTERLMYIY